VLVQVLVLATAMPASAFQGPIEDAAPMASASAMASAPPKPIPTPADTSTSSSSDRPVRGPSVRERGGRRSRGASTASGALMLTILIGWMGYYVIKKLRR
jgi:hypothetical protein